MRMNFAVSSICLGASLLGGLPQVSAAIGHEIRRYVLGGGGGMVTSSTYQMHGTIGQPIVGAVQSTTYALYSGFWGPVSGATSGSPDAIGTAPARFHLLASRPNPFRTGTNIGFGVPVGGGPMKLKVFDIEGRLVRTLIDGDRAAGYTAEYWDGRDDADRTVGSGVYFYQLESRDGHQAKKVIYLP